MKMKLSNITWEGLKITDQDELDKLPQELKSLLSSHNGFIIHHGALHVRGICNEPSWHSLQSAMRGKNAFHTLYPNVVMKSDIPFAQDQVGDQYLLRNAKVIHLDAETGEIDEFCTTLSDFFFEIESDIEEYLNVGLDHKLLPGQLLYAYPPFCVKASNNGSSLRPCPAQEVILFHADFAKQMSGLADGTKIKIELND